MVKRVIITASIVAIFTTFLTIPAASDALLAFVFLGIIPGTDMAMPFWAMGLLIIATALVAISWLGRQPMYIGDRAYQQKQAKSEARAYVMKKVVAQKSKKKLVSEPVKPQTKRRYQVAASSN